MPARSAALCGMAWRLAARRRAGGEEPAPRRQPAPVRRTERSPALRGPACTEETRFRGKIFNLCGGARGGAPKARGGREALTCGFANGRFDDGVRRAKDTLECGKIFNLCAHKLKILPRFGLKAVKRCQGGGDGACAQGCGFRQGAPPANDGAYVQGGAALRMSDATVSGEARCCAAGASGSSLHRGARRRVGERADVLGSARRRAGERATPHQGARRCAGGRQGRRRSLARVAAPGSTPLHSVRRAAASHGNVPSGWTCWTRARRGRRGRRRAKGSASRSPPHQGARRLAGQAGITRRASGEGARIRAPPPRPAARGLSPPRTTVLILRARAGRCGRAWGARL